MAGTRLFVRPASVPMTSGIWKSPRSYGSLHSLTRGITTMHSLTDDPAAVRIFEVSPRDGLQNINKTVPTSIKVELIRKLAATGLSSIEATSFVSPKWIPQLVDGGQVMKEIMPLIKDGRVNFPVLIPNAKGLERAAQAHAKEVEVFVSATEAFSRKNTNCSVDEALVRAKEVTAAAIARGLPVRGYVSCIFADPYEGPTDPLKVLDATKRLLDMGCYEVSLGDTLGVGTPRNVQRLFEILLNDIPPNKLAGHFHDTYGQAVANVMKSYEMGVRCFDSSVAGLGGCPYAKGAKGNLASEDIVYTLQQHGITTGIDLTKLVRVGDWISRQLGQPNGSRAGAALYSKLEEEESQNAPNVPMPSRTWKQTHSQEGLTVSRSGNAVRITLTRAQNGNTMTESMLSGLIEIFESLATDKSVFHIVLAAEGKYFCTGMDLSSSGSATSADHSSTTAQFANLKRLFSAIDGAPQTTIAMVNGPCFGGGVGLAFTCDIRLVALSARFTLSEIKLGLSPAIISKYMQREWGIPFFREAMLTGREVSPEELQRIGTVHGIAKDPHALSQMTDEYLDKLSRCAPVSGTMCKELVRTGWTDPGGMKQNDRIKEVYDNMMRPSPEAKFGIEQFRRKVRIIDWGRFWAEPKAKL